MTPDQSDLFRNASPIAEKKIRQARASQAAETARLVRQAMAAALALFRRSKRPEGRKAEV